jgi:Arc/MetJ-type ribon-helix-helix transcriptional regulator
VTTGKYVVERYDGWTDTAAAPRMAATEPWTRKHPTNVSHKPEREKFVDEQVRSGRHASAEQVVAEALSRLVLDEPDEEIGEGIDDATHTAHQRSQEQLARGEGRAWEEVRAESRAKYLGR